MEEIYDIAEQYRKRLDEALNQLAILEEEKKDIMQRYQKASEEEKKEIIGEMEVSRKKFETLNDNMTLLVKAVRELREEIDIDLQ